MKRLKDAMEAALEASRLKSEFLANMSHEIRTPMNGVICMTRLILKMPMESKMRRYAETVDASASALMTIINDVLDFSKIEAGRLTLENVDFDLAEVVEVVVDLLAHRAHGCGVDLEHLLAPDVPTALRGDPGRLRQVLLNLVGNAVKFTGQGHAFVEVHRVHEDSSEVVLRFSVRDTGIGIPAETLPRLFEPFMQADGSTTRKFGGTGLGLAICKQIVEQMGGQIGAESEQGKGSNFWFTLPFQKQVAPAPSLCTESSILLGKRLWLVCGPGPAATILEQYAGGWEMRVETAPTGGAGLEKLRRASGGEPKPDVIIVSRELADMEGLAFANAVRGDGNFADTNLVLLTLLKHRLDLGSLRRAGIAACVTKPIRRSELHDCLAGLFTVAPEPGVEVKAESATATPIPAVNGKPRILVAEDNLINQRVALRQLKKLGLDADLASNGSEALQALDRGDYDIVLMDCHMPEMDGYTATRRIREQAAGNNRLLPRIIAMTANAMAGDRERCLEAGMDDYISKPMQVEVLAATLARNYPGPPVSV
jgi:CheY-like chemotaxis protein